MAQTQHFSALSMKSLLIGLCGMGSSRGGSAGARLEEVAEIFDLPTENLSRRNQQNACDFYTTATFGSPAVQQRLQLKGISKENFARVNFIN